ncbi:unnamed protein product [Urochloa decumbens]|uniref:Uncharacterized protein n=1 Tax=Urochloa decumbens TaxID=240449 RepID=A0ABC9EJ27_9POAL
MLSIKPVVIMGATRTGKTKLSIDVCKKIGGEVVNADKMQIYAGLDITTNKICINDQCGIRHHLIGTISEINDDFSVPFFRSVATTTAESIVRHGNIPVVVGGSNSLIHGFLVDDLDASLINPFAIASYRPSLRFQSCLLWIQSHELVSKEYLSRRVDDMVDAGLLKELKEYFDCMSIHEFPRHTRLARAIGVSELREYFARRKRLCDSINEIKANTQALAEAQTAKIRHIADVWGWPVCSFDVTETIHALLMESSHTAKDLAWERDVHGPALAMVNEFLGRSV